MGNNERALIGFLQLIIKELLFVQSKAIILMLLVGAVDYSLNLWIPESPR